MIIRQRSQTLDNYNIKSINNSMRYRRYKHATDFRSVVANECVRPRRCRARSTKDENYIII